MANIEAFKFHRENRILQVLDQTKLPQSYVFTQIQDCEQGYQAIKNMLVRGAPCIAAVGCLSLIVHLNKMTSTFQSVDDVRHWFKEKAKYMHESRPTAVNLGKALSRLISFIDEQSETIDRPLVLINNLTDFCTNAIERGLQANQELGRYGALKLFRVIKANKITILTHCNTGSLATVGYGTALGVIRHLNDCGRLERAYCTETRPYNQGSRLTAWELLEDGIPATLIADNMVAYLMSTKKVDAVVVGADRVAANGDTANKIGTLQIAVTAKHYRVPFYVAAPTQSIDLITPSAASIRIEERPADELRCFALGGQKIQLAPMRIDVLNPCFDITPAELIEGVITEFGVSRPNVLAEFLSSIEGLKPSNGEALF